ncbi:right-handed parallel beta-helix repeat-containing protein [uncultured Microbulbifer sp.]|uniref:right-handed parallel beta-helix repeat-containing protein n=1 Tax=uncultured Microbulbifer sp. TaxID=348147 RepID=UPI00260F9D0A|nr:right-handed parallel beta-helix repeat-containing protein [uncultured Microbulbifer sp.]
MHVRFTLQIFAVALLVSTTAARAGILRVYPGESIQAAIDAANPGDTILVEPGEYYEDAGSIYGLRITTDNLRLIGKSKNSHSHPSDKAGQMSNRVRLIANGAQETGVYVAPAGCEYKNSACAEELQGFYLRGFSVEGYPANGIQTRWVNGFQFVRNVSVNNLNNGIYPTLSANGLVRDNISYGSLDTAMWVAGSENIRVIGNELFGSVIGFEITVSNQVQASHNKIYDNTVGIGLFHPNGAGNPPLPVMENWVIEHNHIYDNNRPNDAPDGSFQADLPPGTGVLLMGVSNHVVGKNRVANNGFVGIGILGWCSATTGTDNSCETRPPISDPAANDNQISLNTLNGNGESPPGGILDFLAADLVYFQLEVTVGAGNCFKNNKPEGLTFVSSAPNGELPSDNC